jgi:hypothetical protein
VLDYEVDRGTVELNYRPRFLTEMTIPALATCLLLCAPQIYAESVFNQLKDPSDGWFDASDWVLNNAVGFMPVPIIITEPAVGEGLGLAAIFFHPPKDYSAEQYAKSGLNKDEELPDIGSEPASEIASAGMKEFVLPNMSAGVYAKTNNGTWLAGGGHFAHWKEDTIRFNAVLGYASANLKFYGLPGLPQLPNGLKFNGEGLFIDQDISWRLKDSNFFLGTGYTFLQVDTSFDLGQVIPGLPVVDKTSRQSGIGIFMSYDSRDTKFTPSSGIESEISATLNDKAIGSDFDYTKYDASLHKWWNPDPKWVPGLRLDLQYVDGDLPFYSVPFIQLRGIPALRYQGRSVAVAETEVRWNFHPRFSAIGFLGIGVAANKFSDMDQAPSRATQGVGFRYMMARKLGMHVGIDVAQGPEDTYWYVQVGSAW